MSLTEKFRDEVTKVVVLPVKITVTVYFLTYLHSYLKKLAITHGYYILPNFCAGSQ